MHSCPQCRSERKGPKRQPIRRANNNPGSGLVSLEMMLLQRAEPGAQRPSDDAEASSHVILRMVAEDGHEHIQVIARAPLYEELDGGNWTMLLPLPPRRS